jgi:hypothetical protein
MNTFEGFKICQIHKFDDIDFSRWDKSQPLIILDTIDPIIAERDRKLEEIATKLKEWVDNQPRKLYNV